jgi:hypothetical protein
MDATAFKTRFIVHARASAVKAPSTPRIAHDGRLGPNGRSTQVRRVHSHVLANVTPLRDSHVDVAMESE